MDKGTSQVVSILGSLSLQRNPHLAQAVQFTVEGLLLVFADLRWSLWIWNSHSVVVSLRKGDFLAYIDIMDAYLHVPIYSLAPAVFAFCGKEGALLVCSLALWPSLVYLGNKGDVHLALLSTKLYGICMW